VLPVNPYCPWCLEEFDGADPVRTEARRQHMEHNDCGLVPRRERKEARRAKPE
jgi:hypothetical protein